MRSPHTPAYRAMCARLVKAREAAGLTQRDAAKALGVPQSRLSRIESGERRLDVIELMALAKLYRRRIGYFVEG